MLREPIGEYKVGIKKYDTEISVEKAIQRKIPMTFYYPTDSWSKEYPYKNNDYQKEAPNSTDNGVHTFCGENAQLSTKKDKYPIIIYSHGFSGHEMESTVLCADLASSGYVVVSVGHPYGAPIVTYSDGSTFENPEPIEEIKYKLHELAPLWCEDIQTVIDYIKFINKEDSAWKNKLIPEELGCLGVSFGGCCSVISALKEKEINYAINLDGRMFVEPEYIYKEKPIMVMCNPLNFKAYSCLRKNGCNKLTIKKVRNVTHYEFSDGIYLSERGKSDREWADRVSKQRASFIMKFISEWREQN